MELNKVPGYRRALARGFRIEESYREYSYLGAPEFICGVEVGPLTLQAYLQLCAARSPFLVGGRYPFIQDVAVFLFRLSPAYDAAFAAKAAARAEIATLRSLPHSRLRAIARENGLKVGGAFVPRLFSAIGRSRRGDRLRQLLEQHTEGIARNAFSRVRRQFIDGILQLPFSTAVRAITRFIDRMLLDKPLVSRGRNLSHDPSDTSFANDIVHMIAGAHGASRDEILRTPMPEIFQTLRNIHRDNPNCPKRYRAKVHPFATRFTRRHRALAEAAAALAAS